MQMKQLNKILPHLISELAQKPAGAAPDLEHQSLMNKIKVEAEMVTYHHLFQDGKNFNFGDSLDISSSIQTI